MRHWLFLFCSLILASPYVQAEETAPSKETVLATIHFPPYIIESEDGSLRGFDTEVAHEAFKRMGRNLRIEIMPWRRVLASAQNGDIAGVLTCSPRQSFLMSEPISTATNALFIPSNHDFKRYPISNLEDLKKYPDLLIGGVAGYRQLKLLDKLHLKYDTSPDDRSAFKKLFAGRIHVFLSIQEFGEYILNQLHLSHLIKVIPLQSKNYHVCFSKARENSTRLVQDFNKALHSMRADGTYQAIHDKYK